MERVYNTMKNIAVANITIGIVLIILGLTTGILNIIAGGRLLARKDDLSF